MRAVERGLSVAFERAKDEGRLALIPYIVAGYPSVDESVEIGVALVESGADAIELGVPFSDPLADGVTIQRATGRALQLGVSPAVCLDVARRVRERVDAPIVLMGYYNPILRYGPRAFCQDAARSGVNGLIVPDLPPEEAEELLEPASAAGLDVIFLVSPTSTDERLARVGATSSGFIYCAALSGVTGARKSLSEGLGELIGRIRRTSETPVAVGFGISTAEHVRQLRGLADGAIVGSALIDAIDQAPEGERVAAARRFISDLRAAC